MLGAFLWARVSSACVCGPAPPEYDAFREADAVFEGRVVSDERVQRLIAEAAFDHDAIYMPERRVGFHVTRVWKGSVAQSVDVYTQVSSAACGAVLHLETTYVVYADRREDGTLHTGLCTKTARVADAAEHLIALGRGREPDAGAPPPPPVEPVSGRHARAGCRGCSSTAPPDPPLVLLILLAGAWPLRRVE